MSTTTGIIIAVLVLMLVATWYGVWILRKINTSIVTTNNVLAREVARGSGADLEVARLLRLLTERDAELAAVVKALHERDSALKEAKDAHA